jgi:hypothetical protein
MQKLILSYFLSVISVAIASTIPILAIEAQPVDPINPANNKFTGEYIDSTYPQTIEKISDNVVAFRDINGVSRNYYVPDWMFEKYNLRVGSALHLYNRNVIQGTFRDGDREARRDSSNSYIELVSDSLIPNMRSFLVPESRRFCSISQSPASDGLASGRRVWYKSVCCPSTIPVVGAMWAFEKKVIALAPSVIRPIMPIPIPVQSEPAVEKAAPVQGLW